MLLLTLKGTLWSCLSGKWCYGATFSLGRLSVLLYWLTHNVLSKIRRFLVINACRCLKSAGIYISIYISLEDRCKWIYLNVKKQLPLLTRKLHRVPLQSNLTPAENQTLWLLYPDSNANLLHTFFLNSWPETFWSVGTKNVCKNLKHLWHLENEFPQHILDVDLKKRKEKKRQIKRC